jgi:hypothetical protein
MLLLRALLLTACALTFAGTPGLAPSARPATGQPATHVSAPTQTAPPAWYRRSRALEITGSNPRDSVVLVANGRRPDSLSIEITFFVSGIAVYRRTWTSADDFADEDARPRSAAALAAFMRARLDTVVALVKRQPINREQVSHVGDEALLRTIAPRPTHQLMLSFGVENTEFLVWNPTRRTLVVFMECC